MRAVADHFAEQDGEPRDELWRVPGIGGVTARMLLSMNVRSFRQIVSLTPELTQSIEVALNWPPGHIERLGWVEAARRHHAERYGEQI